MLCLGVYCLVFCWGVDTWLLLGDWSCLCIWLVGLYLMRTQLVVVGFSGLGGLYGLSFVGFDVWLWV